MYAAIPFCCDGVGMDLGARFLDGQFRPFREHRLPRGEHVLRRNRIEAVEQRHRELSPMGRTYRRPAGHRPDTPDTLDTSVIEWLGRARTLLWCGLSDGDPGYLSH
jgi:hypothetical protein